MSKKIECMQGDPELFKRFMKAAGRAKYLNAAVFLKDDSIALLIFKLSEEDVGRETTAIAQAVTFKDYDEEALTRLGRMLDIRADTMKEKYLSTYQQLANAAESDDLVFDLEHRDYVIMSRGSDIGNRHIYRLTWSLEDVQNAADYVSKCLIPNLPEDDED